MTDAEIVTLTSFPFGGASTSGVAASDTITGASVSAGGGGFSTVTLKEPLAVLLRESPALQFTGVVPVEKVDPEAGVQTTATEPSTRSIAVAVKVTVLFCVVMFAGSESTGAVVSTTMILNVPFEHCTVVVPMGKIEPDAGAQLPRGRPFSSS